MIELSVLGEDTSAGVTSKTQDIEPAPALDAEKAAAWGSLCGILFCIVIVVAGKIHWVHPPF